MVLQHGFTKKTQKTPKPVLPFVRDRKTEIDHHSEVDWTMRRKPNPHIGSSFDALLDEEGLLEASEEQAIKELPAEQIRQTIQEKGLARTAMAASMQTSRASLNRLLDPRNAL